MLKLTTILWLHICSLICLSRGSAKSFQIEPKGKCTPTPNLLHPTSYLIEQNANRVSDVNAVNINCVIKLSDMFNIIQRTKDSAAGDDIKITFYTEKDGILERITTVPVNVNDFDAVLTQHHNWLLVMSDDVLDNSKIESIDRYANNIIFDNCETGTMKSKVGDKIVDYQKHTMYFCADRKNDTCETHKFEPEDKCNLCTNKPVSHNSNEHQEITFDYNDSPVRQSLDLTVVPEKKTSNAKLNKGKMLKLEPQSFAAKPDDKSKNGIGIINNTGIKDNQPNQIKDISKRPGILYNDNATPSMSINKLDNTYPGVNLNTGTQGAHYPKKKNVFTEVKKPTDDNNFRNTVNPSNNVTRLDNKNSGIHPSRGTSSTYQTVPIWHNIERNQIPGKQQSLADNLHEHVGKFPKIGMKSANNDKKISKNVSVYNDNHIPGDNIKIENKKTPLIISSNINGNTIIKDMQPSSHKIGLDMRTPTHHCNNKLPFPFFRSCNNPRPLDVPVTMKPENLSPPPNRQMMYESNPKPGFTPLNNAIVLTTPQSLPMNVNTTNSVLGSNLVRQTPPTFDSSYKNSDIVSNIIPKLTPNISDDKIHRIIPKFTTALPIPGKLTYVSPINFEKGNAEDSINILPNKLAAPMPNRFKSTSAIKETFPIAQEALIKNRTEAYSTETSPNSYFSVAAPIGSLPTTTYRPFQTLNVSLMPNLNSNLINSPNILPHNREINKPNTLDTTPIHAVTKVITPFDNVTKVSKIDKNEKSHIQKPSKLKTLLPMSLVVEAGNKKICSLPTVPHNSKYLCKAGSSTSLEGLPQGSIAQQYKTDPKTFLTRPDIENPVTRCNNKFQNLPISFKPSPVISKEKFPPSVFPLENIEQSVSQPTDYKPVTTVGSSTSSPVFLSPEPCQNPPLADTKAPMQKLSTKLPKPVFTSSTVDVSSCRISNRKSTIHGLPTFLNKMLNQQPDSTNTEQIQLQAYTGPNISSSHTAIVPKPVMANAKPADNIKLLIWPSLTKTDKPTVLPLLGDTSTVCTSPSYTKAPILPLSTKTIKSKLPSSILPQPTPYKSFDTLPKEQSLDHNPSLKFPCNVATKGELPQSTVLMSANKTSQLFSPSTSETFSPIPINASPVFPKILYPPNKNFHRSKKLNPNVMTELTYPDITKENHNQPKEVQKAYHLPHKNAKPIFGMPFPEPIKTPSEVSDTNSSNNVRNLTTTNSLPKRPKPKAFNLRPIVSQLPAPILPQTLNSYAIPKSEVIPLNAAPQTTNTIPTLQYYLPYIPESEKTQIDENKRNIFKPVSVSHPLNLTTANSCKGYLPKTQKTKDFNPIAPLIFGVTNSGDISNQFPIPQVDNIKYIPSIIPLSKDLVKYNPHIPKSAKTRTDEIKPNLPKKQGAKYFNPIAPLIFGDTNSGDTSNQFPNPQVDNTKHIPFVITLPNDLVQYDPYIPESVKTLTEKNEPNVFMPVGPVPVPPPLNLITTNSCKGNLPKTQETKDFNPIAPMTFGDTKSRDISNQFPNSQVYNTKYIPSVITLPKDLVQYYPYIPESVKSLTEKNSPNVFMPVGPVPVSSPLNLITTNSCKGNLPKTQETKDFNPIAPMTFGDTKSRDISNQFPHPQVDNTKYIPSIIPLPKDLVKYDPYIPESVKTRTDKNKPNIFKPIGPISVPSPLNFITTNSCKGNLPKKQEVKMFNPIAPLTFGNTISGDISNQFLIPQVDNAKYIPSVITLPKELVQYYLPKSVKTRTDDNKPNIFKPIGPISVPSPLNLITANSCKGNLPKKQETKEFNPIATLTFGDTNSGDISNQFPIPQFDNTKYLPSGISLSKDLFTPKSNRPYLKTTERNPASESKLQPRFGQSQQYVPKSMLNRNCVSRNPFIIPTTSNSSPIITPNVKPTKNSINFNSITPSSTNSNCLRRNPASIVPKIQTQENLSNLVTINQKNEMTNLESAIVDYLKCYIKNNLTDLGNFDNVVNIPLSVHNNGPYYKIDTNNPNVYIRGWDSKLRTAEVEMKLNLKDITVRNFVPIVKKGVCTDHKNVQKLTEDIITETYGAPIIMNEPYSSNKEKVLNKLKNVKYSNNCSVLWSECYC